MPNNRELASVVWLLLFLAWALSKPGVRESLANVARAFFRRQILLMVAAVAGYAAAVVFLLALGGLWQIGLLKDTLLWFCGGAMAMVSRAVTSRDSENALAQTIRDSLTIAVVVEFLLNTYTFSLPVELIIVPVATIIAMLHAVAALDTEYKSVARVTGALQVVVGFTILGSAAWRALHDYRALGSPEAWMSLGLAPLLSILFIPCLYFIVLLSEYEMLFVNLRIGADKSRHVQAYARRQLILYAGASLRKACNLRREHAGWLRQTQTAADVDELMARIRSS